LGQEQQELALMKHKAQMVIIPYFQLSPQLAAAVVVSVVQLVVLAVRVAVLVQRKAMAVVLVVLEQQIKDMLAGIQRLQQMPQEILMAVVVEVLVLLELIQ
jgi:hypothetical protein